MVNLAEAVVGNGKVPSNAPDQPKKYFKGSKFRLPEFVGSNSKTVEEIKKIDMACEGTTLSFAKGMKSYQITKSFDTKCSCGRLNKNVQSTVFEDVMTSKVGIKMETVKNL